LQEAVIPFSVRVQTSSYVNPDGTGHPTTHSNVVVSAVTQAESPPVHLVLTLTL